MKFRFLLLTAVALPSIALAQNAPSGSPRVQGVPDGYGDPVQVTIVGANGADAASSVDVTKINSVTPLMGNGVTGTGSQRVTIASNNTAFNIIAAGDVASGAADSGNPVKFGCLYTTSTPTYTTGQRGNCLIDNSGNLMTRLSVTAGPAGAVASINGVQADDQSNTITTYKFIVRPEFFDGTNWDRGLAVVTGTDSVGSGIAAAGQLGQLDDTSPSTVTENRFGNVRIGAQRQQLSQSPSPYPYSPILGTSATPIRGASGNVANANAVATLTGTATTTVYITGFTCTAGGATAAAEVDVAVTGPLGGTMTYTQGAPLGATVPPSILNVIFNPAYPASAVNTTIVVTMPALGAGNAHAACVATGFYM